MPEHKVSTPPWSMHCCGAIMSWPETLSLYFISLSPKVGFLSSRDSTKSVNIIVYIYGLWYYMVNRKVSPLTPRKRVRCFWQPCTLAVRFFMIWVVGVSPDPLTEPDFWFSFFKDPRFRHVCLRFRANGVRRYWRPCRFPDIFLWYKKGEWEPIHWKRPISDFRFWKSLTLAMFVSTLIFLHINFL